MPKWGRRMRPIPFIVPTLMGSWRVVPFLFLSTEYWNELEAVPTTVELREIGDVFRSDELLDGRLSSVNTACREQF